MNALLVVVPIIINENTRANFQAFIAWLADTLDFVPSWAWHIVLCFISFKALKNMIDIFHVFVSEE